MPYCPECSASVPQGVETCPICGAALVDTPTTGDDYPAQPELDVKALEKQLSTALAPRYELLKLLGAGGMGAVFLAREAALKRLVAVKVLAPALAAYQPARVRFQREARAAAALSHPNVVRVYAVGETRGKLPYIIMQYVEGLALHDWLLQRGRVPERDARRIIGEVAAALAAAHARDLVHRDVKPANVLIETETGRAFVADFGVSAALSPAGRQETKLTSTGMIIGTPPYMSPEQAAGDAVTPKSDVYSLGILAYELLAGTLPFAANTAAGWAAAHLRDTPESVATKRSELTPQLVRLVARCLAKPTDDRPSAAEVARALLPSLETEIRWPPPGLGALFGRGAGFTRELLITAGAGVLVLLALAFTPHVLEVHDHWLSRFTLDPAAGAGLAQARPSPDSSQVSFFVWQTALILGSAVFLLGVFYLAAVVYWLRRALRYRALGWSWLTLFDVAADADGRSGMLLAGGGEFGFLDQPERGRILRARRLRVAWLLAAALWLFTVLGIWIGSAVLGLFTPEAAAPLAGTARLTIALVPLVGLLGLADLAARTERRWLGPVSPRGPAAVTRVEVEEWYRTVPGSLAGQPDPRTYARGRRLHRAAVAAAIVTALVIAVGLGEVVLASIAAARFVQWIAPRAAELNAAVRRLSTADPYTETRRLLAPYLPAQALLPDTTVRRVIRQLFDRDSLQPPPPAPSVAPPVPGIGSREEVLHQAVRRAYDRALPLEVVRVLDSVAVHPRVEAFQALARASSVDLVAALQDGPITELTQRGGPSALTLLQTARLNTLGAIAEIQRGDTAGAAQRLGEGAAVAQHLFRSPLHARFAYDLLRWDVLSPLASLLDAEGRTNEALALRAARDALVSARTALPRTGIVGLAAEAPEMPLFARVVLRSPLPEGERLDLLTAGWAGLCANPAEIMLGPGRARTERLRAIADSMRSPHAADLLALARRPWVRPLSWSPPSERALGRFLDRGPVGVMARILACTWEDRVAR
ncbi:MAG: protein kinase [Gemmatimonadetes bacterium]|nr:protein kinase [Gemmatimonadota bacterium]